MERKSPKGELLCTRESRRSVLLTTFQIKRRFYRQEMPRKMPKSLCSALRTWKNMRTCFRTLLQITRILFRYSLSKAGSIWRKRHNFDASLDKMLLLKTSQEESHGTSWSGRWRTHLPGRFTWLIWRKNCKFRKRNGSIEKRNVLRLKRKRLRLQDLKKRQNARGVLNAAIRLW